MKTLAVLQARLSSTRLPGKVLQDILGKPMLLLQIERIQRSKAIDKLVIATSHDPSDDPIADFLIAEGIDSFRGDLDDVLDRFYQAARLYCPENVVRLTGDCPLYDPEIGDAVINFHLQNKYDYTSNTRPPTFPDGLDVEVMTFAALKKAWQSATLKSEREHVTPYLYSHPGMFSLGSFQEHNDYSGLRWTVDEASDLVFVRNVYQELYLATPNFSWKDVLNLLSRQPELADINTGITRNEGYLKSLMADLKGKQHD